MDALGRMRVLGFRKWYERQLVESHLYLTSCFLGIIAVAASLELFGARKGFGGAMLALAIGLGGLWAGLFGWRRYRRIMLVAEHIGDHAHCPACGAYAKFSVVEAGRALHEEPANIENPEEVWLRARCRKCGNEWVI
ncbi:MAG: hypothetical protein LC123_02040 [Burkholderiales bacterium]|jgi:hypothetical protein|uniref:Uncharacterized protein n=1 Tax=Candidatus Desulfobacillus denitrificans TaxID=2608985 RepID=A0A809RUR1_9PROT|nr:hypothetical protein [Zoogloeaceae bacterium]MBV6410458.1 hypothetical protein [Rhodocyclaceae bacterium]MCZ2173092.1 hypothetical protein [Burkholderiales bacterium]BBO20147.1 conserved hypothetical protein [Candidatus Desulfobacillus denitrificans]GIK46042.1 MAG: hypothetical protein BroJett012_19450 [Betaproteobacteria bacterium]